eukprot:s854_g8.t1
MPHDQVGLPISPADSSSSSAAELNAYSDVPQWMDNLLRLSGIHRDADENVNMPDIPVLTWYVDHETNTWCNQPKIVHLGPVPDLWFQELRFPWIPHIPFRERVFVDVVNPNPPKYPYETHVADVILTTRPILVSALVSVSSISTAPGELDRVTSIYRIAGIFARTVTLTDLRTQLSFVDDLVLDGFQLTSPELRDPAQPLQVRDGKCLSIFAIKEVRETMHDDDTNVLLDLTNLPFQSKKQHKRLPESEECAPLSFQAVLSSPNSKLHIKDPGVLDAVSHMQLSGSVSCKHSPFTDQEDVLMQAFRDGHAQPQENIADDEDFDLERDSSGYEPSIASTEQPMTPEEDPTRQDVFLYHLDDDPVPRDRVVDAYEVVVTLPDLPEATSAAIVHLTPDLPPGHLMCLVLFDIAFHGHKSERHYKVGPAIDRQVIPTPRRATRHNILVLAQVDQYCDMEGGRCLVHLNHNRWPDYDDSVRIISPGDYIKISVPPSDNYICATERLVRLVQEGNSHQEILDNVMVDEITGGYSPDMLDQDAVRALRSINVRDEEDDTTQALQLSLSPVKHSGLQSADSIVPARCSFTDEFIEAVPVARQAADNEVDVADDDETVPSIFVQELDELWHSAAEHGHIQSDQRVRVESWFTDHMRHTRCHNSRITQLSADANAWERQLLETWNDRVSAGAETEFAIVYPPTEDIAVNVIAQVVIVQRPQLDHRSLVITVYDSPHTFALVLYERIGLEYVLEDLRLTHDCPPIRPQNECTLWFGSYPIRDGQLVHLRHGNALRLYIRRGIPVDLSALHLMSDSRLRQVLQDAIWGELYIRPPHPVPPGESSSLRASSFVSQSISAIAETNIEETYSDSRPQWIQDLNAVFERHSFTERADEGPVMYVLVWYLHGLSRERSGNPQTVRLGRILFEWRTELVFAWREHIERGVPIDFHVVRPEPPSQPWQFISAHVILSQSLQSEQTALIISTIIPGIEANSIQHIACVLPRHITSNDVHSVGVAAPLRARAFTVSRGNRLIHQGQQLLVQTGESLTVILARHDPPPIPDTGPSNHDQQDTQEDDDDAVLMQTQPCAGGGNAGNMQVRDLFPDQVCASNLPFVFNVQAPEFSPNPESLPPWTAAIDDIYQVWQTAASSWEGEARSAHFLSWYVAPAIGRDHCWTSRKVALFVDFWQWKQILGIRWRDELDLSVDFDILFVRNPPSQMEDGISGHIILVQHPRPDRFAVLISVHDPAIHDGHHFKTVHVLPEKVVAQDVFHAVGYGNDCAHNAKCGLRCKHGWMQAGESVEFQQADACEIIVQRRGVPGGWTPPFIPDSPGAEGLSMLQTRATHVSTVSSEHGANARTEEKAGSTGKSSVTVSLAQLLGEYVDDIANKPFSLAELLRTPDAKTSAVVVCAWEVAHGLTQTDLVAAGQFDRVERSRIFQTSHGLLHSCSALFPVNFVRDGWGFSAEQWMIGSYVCPSADKAIVAVVEYYDDGATYRTVTLDQKQNIATVKSALFTLHGSLMRINGFLVHGEINLEHGDVIEVRVSASKNTIPIHPDSNRVQVCLSACLPGPSIPFSDADQAFDILPERNIKHLLEASEGWKFDFIPEGVDLHPTTFDALHTQVDIDATQAASLELYIDGATCRDGSAWAVVAVYASESGRRLCGCLAGCTEVNQHSNQWIGASKHSNVEAETSAMVIAAAFSFYAVQDIPVVIRPDLALSRHFLELQNTSHQETLVAKFLFMLGQMLPGDVKVAEVRAHTGDPWNELADAVAKWAARSQSCVGAVPWTLLHSLIRQPESLQWEWLRHIPASFRSAMPNLHDESVWQPVPSNLHVGTEVVRDKPVEKHIQVRLKVGSYNALALNDEQREFGAPGVRSVRLDHQFHENKLVFVGIQEARTPEGMRVTDHYKIMSSGFQQCGNTVHFGCELWIDKSLPIATRVDGSHVKASDCKVTLQRADSRAIVASFEGPVSLKIIVGHAPCLTSDRSIHEVTAWWNVLLGDIRDCPSSTCLLAFLDANAPLADEETRYYGKCGAEDMNPAGTAFQDFLTQGRLYAPSTLGFHLGPQATWRHPRGRCYRRDYVLVNEASMAMVQNSSVITLFDGGFGHADHVPVALELQGLMVQQSAQLKYKWDYAKLHSADAKAQFQRALSTLPVPAWQTSVDDHSNLLESNILQLAQQHFGAPAKRPNRPLLKESTCNGIMLKRQALDMMRRNEFDDPALRQEIKLLESILRPRILQDQQTWYASWLDDIDDDYRLHDTAQVYKKLQRLGRRKKDLGKGPRPLPRLRSPDGSTAGSFTECQSIWRDQFALIEAGISVSDLQLQQLHQQGHPCTDKDVDACISPCEVLEIIRRFKNGKVPGPGSLPVDVIKSGGFEIAQLLTPLLVKASWHIKEPLTWKGGILIPLFKGKGSPNDPQAYRSIFLSDVCAKIHHAKMRRSLAKEWNAENTLIQLGGKRGCSTDVAHHFLHSHLTWAKSANILSAMLFVDLQAAFYSVLRSSLFEGEFHDDVVCFAMQRLGILPTEWHSIRDTILRDHAIGGMGGHHAGILRDMFTGTHFEIQCLPGKTATMRGTRPGDPVADVLFNMAFKLVVLDARQRILESSALQWFGDPCSADDICVAREAPRNGFAEVTFVDDIAYAIHAQSADSLILSLQLVASCLHDAAFSRGLTLNYQAGKTEAVVSLAGPGSRTTKQRIWHQLQGSLPVVTEHDAQKLRIVHSYKHLGSFLQDHGIIQKDAKHRVAQARKAFGQLHRPFYGKRNVNLNTKAAVFSSLVVSRHVYNTHTWACATESEIDSWHNGLKTQVAVLAKQTIRPVAAFHFSTDELYALVGINAPGDLLHANRLRYASRAVKGAPAWLWTFLHAAHGPRSWFSLLQDSITWLSRHIPGGLSIDATDITACFAANAEGKLWTIRVQNQIRKFSAYESSAEAASSRKWQCRAISHVHTSDKCKSTLLACFVPAEEDVVETVDAEDAVIARTLKSQGWLPTKAFLPAVRVPLPLLPAADTPEAALMRQRWHARISMQGDAYQRLDGFCAHDSSEIASEDASEVEIIPFVMHTNGGKDQGLAGVFQQYGLAAEAARLHVTCLLFIHFYSGFRRDGDLQHCIEHQSTIDGVHLFCISIDLCLAKKHSDLTDERTKKFWIGKMKGGQIIGVGGGPSCETWSAARYCPPGPGPVRSHKCPWGIEGLTRKQWRQVNIGTVLIMFLVDLLWEATILGLCGFLEHPQFPVWLMRVAPASLWSLKVITALSKLACYQICSFDQCAEAQNVLDVIGLRVGDHVRNALQDTLTSRSSRAEESMAYKGPPKIQAIQAPEDHSWSTRPWNSSFSSEPRFQEAYGGTSDPWDSSAASYWLGHDMYSSLFNPPAAWMPWSLDSLAPSFNGWPPPASGKSWGSEADGKAFSRSDAPETPRLLRPMKIPETAEPTPATTAGTSSLHRSPLEEVEEPDRTWTPLQKVLFGDSFSEVPLDGP